MRYPIEPLATAAGVDLHHPDHATNTPTGQTLLADILHINLRTVQRARAHGLDYRQADHWANTIGRHPADIWGRTWYDHADDDIPTHCTCHPRHQRPHGHICDRCGGLLAAALAS